MAKWHKQWAKKARSGLLDALGRVCVRCGATENLTFDCKVPTGDDHHKGSTDQRMTFYLREHEKGNVQVLCHPCNSSKKAREDVDPWEDITGVAKDNV